MPTPITLVTPAEMQAWSNERYATGRRIGLVPTMGALHDGHLALIDEARRLTDDVVVSIFVNPLQFDRSDDFDLYPRPHDADVERCAERGVAAVYRPAPRAMYPAGFDTTVQPGKVAAGFEGAARPGHFTGVATVVTKLFATVRPHVAVFGEKDAQQLAVIRRLAADLDLGVEVIGLPTVREPDGLALSSRNLRLGPDDRAAAVCIPRALDAVADAVDRGIEDAARLADLVASVIDAEPRARLDHVGVVDPETFEAVSAVGGSGALVVVAVWFGDVRLIDNRRLSTRVADDHRRLDA